MEAVNFVDAAGSFFTINTQARTVTVRSPFGAVRKYRVKDGVNVDEMISRWAARPDMWRVRRPSFPSERTLERWISDGVARAVDGCLVEADGVCPHGAPAWPRVMGII